MRLLATAILAATLLAWVPGTSLAQASPVILYTDILSGPNSGTNDGPGGAYLSVFGTGFGNDVNDISVTIGGGEAGAYKYLGPSLGRPDIQQLSVQLGPECQTGPIVVTVNGESSNTDHTFTVRPGNVYFVSLTGSDSTGIANDIGHPFRTPNHVKGLSEFGAGDFIVVRGGTYDLDDGNNGLYYSSWVRASKSGSEGNPLAVLGYPGEVVTLQIDSSLSAFAIPVGGFSNWVFADFGMDVTTCDNGAIIQVGGSATSDRCLASCRGPDAAGNVSIVNIDITGNDVGLMCGEGGGFNPVVVAYSHDVKVLGVFVHNGGPMGDTECRSHTFYLSTTQCDVELGWSGVYDMPNGRAHLQIHQDSFDGSCWGPKLITDIYVHDNIFYNLRGQPVLMDGSTGDIWFYDNIIYDSTRELANYEDILSLRGGGGALYPRIYNNTFYVNPYYDSPGWLISFGGPSGYDPEMVELYNNIFYVTESQDSYFYHTHPSWDIDANVISDNNIWYGSGQGLPSFAGSNDLNADPMLTTPESGDFAPLPDSPACGSGVDGRDIGAISCQPVVCNEDWTCTDWSACSVGTRSRVCTDQNGCGTTSDKPPETQDCSETSPAILFSDLTDGVTSGGHWGGAQEGRGAAVSVWGRNLGSTRGASTVTVCGVTLDSDDDFAEWGATTNPTVPLGMERITFWLDPGMQTGPGTIQVTTDDGSSETIPFYCRSSGNIYFLDSANGQDGFNGLYPNDMGNGVDGPKRLTSWARGNLQAGDVVYLRGGVYQDHDVGDMYHYGGLFSFGREGGAPDHNNGLEGNSISVSAYPGELVKLKATDHCGGGVCLTKCISMFYAGTQLDYWTFSKFNMNATESAVQLGSTGYVNGGTSNIRLIGIDGTTIYDPDQYNGCIFSLYGSENNMEDFHILGCYLHDQLANYRGMIWEDVNDEERAYQVYVGGYGQIKNFEMGWNEMGWGSMGRGVQIYGHLPEDSIENLVVHDNWFHHNRRQAFILGGGDGGSDYGFVKSAYFYNNILDHSGWPTGDDWSLIVVGGVGWGRFGGGFYLYNNVFDGSSLSFPPLNPTGHMDLMDFRNNIVITQPNAWDYETNYPDSECTNCHGSNNLWFGAGEDAAPSWDTSLLDNANPQFVSSNPSSWQDFRLQEGSQAIDAGTSSVFPVVTADFVGISRPQGSGYDIGVFEFAGPATTQPTYHPADTGENCGIDLDEMTKYIGYWYADSTSYPIYRVIEAIGFYKSDTNSCG